jgi:hypothetical protein
MPHWVSNPPKQTRLTVFHEENRKASNWSTFNFFPLVLSLLSSGESFLLRPPCHARCRQSSSTATRGYNNANPRPLRPVAELRPARLALLLQQRADSAGTACQTPGAPACVAGLFALGHFHASLASMKSGQEVSSLKSQVSHRTGSVR